MRFWNGGSDAIPAPQVEQELRQLEQHRPFPWVVAVASGLATLGLVGLVLILVFL